MSLRIAALITSFNRKSCTLRCVEHILAQNCSQVRTDIFLVDAGSSDGTVEEISEKYPSVNCMVAQGLYWAGGMREAWKKAAESGEYDFFWLLNDDTVIYPDALESLLSARDEVLLQSGKEAICVGPVCDPDSGEQSYGGRKLCGGRRFKSVPVPPDGELKDCELGNANIMLVPRGIYESIGGLSPDYTHGIADYDYTLTAVEKGFGCVIAREFCGECIDDHGHNWLPQSEPLGRRIEYLYSPKGLACKEYLHFLSVHFPFEVVPAFLKLWAKTLFPIIWTRLKK